LRKKLSMTGFSLFILFFGDYLGLLVALIIIIIMRKEFNR